MAENPGRPERRHWRMLRSAVLVGIAIGLSLGTVSAVDRTTQAHHRWGRPIRGQVEWVLREHYFYDDTIISFTGHDGVPQHIPCEMNPNYLFEGSLVILWQNPHNPNDLFIQGSFYRGRSLSNKIWRTTPWPSPAADIWGWTIPAVAMMVVAWWLVGPEFEYWKQRRVAKLGP